MFRNGGSNIYNSWANDNRVCKFVLLPGTKADPQLLLCTNLQCDHSYKMETKVLLALHLHVLSLSFFRYEILELF
jgi:hypothetical protein